jgi:Flp pilus assembly protein TadG
VSKLVARTLRKQRGVSLVEQALTITFLCTLLFGIVDCGRMLYAYHFVSAAARDASRWASVRSQDSSLGNAQFGVQALVRPPAGMGIDPAQVSSTINFGPPPNGSPRCPAGVNKTGCMVSVQVTYNFRFILPLMPRSAVTMRSTSETVITQ